MNDDKDKTEKSDSIQPIESENHIFPQSGSEKRTVMLRVKSKVDNSSLLERLIKVGAEVVSHGDGVIVIEADSEAIEQLSHNKDVLAVSEERKFEMRLPSMPLKDK